MTETRPEEQDSAPKNSVSAYEHFLSGSVWRELQGIIEERIVSARDQLEDPQETLELEEVRVLQGRITEDRFILAQVPDLLADAKFRAAHPAVPKEGVENV